MYTTPSKRARAYRDCGLVQAIVSSIAVALSANPAFAVVIDPTAGIFIAGRTDITDSPADMTPPPMLATPGGQAWQFINAGGQIDFFAGTGLFYGPEGSDDVRQSDLNSYGGISGFKGRRGPIVGVFLDDNIPATDPPVTLDFTGSGLGSDFETLAPALRQIFFIGDGLTSTGMPQTFTAPPGATRLFVGIADGGSTGGFTGNLCCYGDNDGFYEIEPIMVPEPAALIMTMLASIVCLHRPRR